MQEADLAGGGKAVFFVQGNHAISIYVFDVATSTASFAGGDIAADGSFSLVASNGATITGSVHDDDNPEAFDDDEVTATIGGQTVTGIRSRSFGPSDDIPGRFTGTAQSVDGATREIKIVVDSQNQIFFITEDGTSVRGGFGAVTVTPVAKAISTDKHGDDDPPGDDHGQDNDDLADFNEDLNDDHPNTTFSLTLLSGEAVTGNLAFGHGAFLGDFTLGGVTYFFRAPQESSENHLANISTRGFVSTGQGQLIGGFVITGGPKLVLIRALGPSLAAFGVSPVLENPVLQLFSGSTQLRSNDDWQSASNSDDITATALPPSDSNEASILVRLEPGFYTAIVTGANEATGIALIEIYEMERD
ncbi:MAG TPA: hypothetical protein VH207_11615 [Chthoniobacterales bacterium]|nr:hypothetical protein [Chthoniobacterales bacterium]